MHAEIRNEESDHLLLARSAAGSPEAFRRLFERHSRGVLRLALRYAGNRADAEDICQEVFLQVWRNAAGFRGEARFSTWLYRIAVNRCLSHRRRRAAPESLEEAEEVADPREHDPETARLVGEAVGRLPGRQRLAVILAHFEGRPYREIAGLLGTTVPAVESLLFRARAGLRRRLGRLLE